MTATALPLIHVPLAPFDSPADHPCQRRAGSKDDRIRWDRHYFARIFGEWFLGQFEEEWYGWSFMNWGTSGIQLDSIEDLYEVDLGPLEGKS